MTKNYKWGTEFKSDAPMHVVLFVSRNKDNAGVANFSDRRQSFVTREPIDSKNLKKQFDLFVKAGVKGETSRMYYSVNARNEQKIYKELIHFMIDTPEFNICAMNPKIASIAAKADCAATKHWMFDFDIDDANKATEFINDIKSIDATVDVTAYKTPHGYAIVCNHGFDVRKLYEKWDRNLTDLKKDDLICISWKTKK